MSTTTQTQPVKSNVAQNVEVNLDEIFNAAPSGADILGGELMVQGSLNL